MKPWFFFLFAAVAAVVSAQPMNRPPAIPLWPEGAPGALGTAAEDVPTLTGYFPRAADRNGASLVVLPGGGYAHLSEHEGQGYAEWLTGHGVTVYVLQYRLGPKYHHPAMLHDVARALRTVRAWAKRDGLDPQRVGVMGSSAGGHLAATLLTHFDAGRADSADPIERESSRPDLGVLAYPVISMGKFAHQGSRDRLLGPAPGDALLQDMSLELQVKPDTPPTFIWSTNADATVPVENSLLFAEALRRAGVPFALHIYEQGAHGLGLGRPDRPAPPWASQLLYWFGERKFLAPAR